MFLIIGGISPKMTTLDQNPRRCPHCGLTQAYFTRVDHYLNLFFIPLFPVKRGEPVLLCRNCQQTSGGPPVDGRTAHRPEALTCSHCGGKLNPNFAFCPYCGKEV